MADAYSFLSRTVGKDLIIDMEGNLKLGPAVDALREAAKSVTEGNGRLILNLSDLAGMDSSGLGEIVAAHLALKKSLGLYGLKKKFVHLFGLTKLNTVLNIYDSEAEALASVPGRELARRPVPPAAATAATAAHL